MSVSWGAYLSQSAVTFSILMKILYLLSRICLNLSESFSESVQYRNLAFPHITWVFPTTTILTNFVVTNETKRPLKPVEYELVCQNWVISAFTFIARDMTQNQMDITHGYDTKQINATEIRSIKNNKEKRWTQE